MYAAILSLPDTLDAAWYTVHGDSLIVWGGGDPGTLYPDINGNSALMEDIRHSSAKTIIISNAHFQTTRYGKGWAWDDFPYSYQCERNALPMYGNSLWIDRNNDEIIITPSCLSALLHIQKDTLSTTDRTAWGDEYTYTYNARIPKEQARIPIGFFKNDIRDCWSENTGRQLLQMDYPFSMATDSVKGTVRDTLIQHMIRESDNFIAEQLLLAAALKAKRVMSEKVFIDDLLEHGWGQQLPDVPKWVDGSGLSRYNQTTPRDVVWVLNKILQWKGREYVKSIFPAGGLSGTIKDGFTRQNGKAYLFAKSGGMSQVYNLSGYLFTRSGKVLVFAWMNNHYQGTTADLKSAMNSFLTILYNNY
jgi:D-alanyl-D-alanine carboxypeptidase/D-alanyl-D-alanine-endopeptidase (penicillin-binding protein 4)